MVFDFCKYKDRSAYKVMVFIWILIARLQTVIHSFEPYAQMCTDNSTLLKIYTPLLSFYRTKNVFVHSSK